MNYADYYYKCDLYRDLVRLYRGESLGRTLCNYQVNAGAWTDTWDMNFNQEKYLADTLANIDCSLKHGASFLPYIELPFGRTLLPAAFGCKLVIEHDKPLKVNPALQSIDEVDRLQPLRIEDSPHYRLAVEMIEYIKRETNNQLPIYPGNFMGPMSFAFDIRGEGLLLDVVDQPDKVHRLLRLVTDATIAFKTRIHELIGGDLDEMVHLVPRGHGGANCNQDYCELLNPAMYEEFDFRYSEEYIRAFGGGHIHMCGKAWHVVDKFNDFTKVHHLNGDPNHMSPLDLAKRLPEYFFSGPLLGRYDKDLTLPQQLAHTMKTLRTGTRFMATFTCAESELAEVQQVIAAYS